MTRGTPRAHRYSRRMTAARSWPLPVLLAACTATDQGAQAPAANGPRAVEATAKARRTLATAMHDVESHVDRLDRILLGAAPGDLVAAAHTATETAALVRLGYGEFERKDVKDFAHLARDAESWLLQVSLEARQGHGQLAADLFRTGREDHCTRCHDAVDRAAR